MKGQQCPRKDTVETGAGTVGYRPRPVVLAIDDEPGVRESLQLILQEEFEVLEAADGASALALLGERQVDVALLDVRMPGEPGSAVLPKILAIDDSIPVILITADPHLRMAVDAMKAGAYDYVAKPYDVDEILSLVRQAAQQRGLERELRYLRDEMDRAHGFDQLVGRHPRTHAGMLAAILRTAGARSEERAIAERAWRLLEDVGLADQAHAEAGSLPFGKQRLLEIARALATEPRLLLLDEPAAGLNAREAAELGELIQSIRARGVTTLLVEHHMDLVMEISDEILVLNFGEALAQGPPAAVRNDRRVIQAYLGDENALAEHLRA